MPGLAEYTAQPAKTQRFPQFVECPDVTERTGRLELNVGRRRIQKIRPSGDFEQARDDGIEAFSQLIQATERDQGAMLGLAGVVAESFDKLEILARTGAGDLEEHAKTLTARQGLSNMAAKTTYVPLHDFLENCLKTRMAAWTTSPKWPFLGSNCRTRVEKIFVTGARGLTSVADLSGCRDLNEIELDGCKQVHDLLETLDGCGGLEKLVLMKVSDLGNIQFIERMPNLKWLNMMDTNVIDGDMSFLLRHPSLEYAVFTSKKHFSHTEAQVRSVLQAKKNG